MTRRLTYPEAAAELRVEESWLRRHIKKLPHSKKGRVVTFSDADLEAIDAQFHHEPEQTPRLRPVGPHPLAELKPLPSRRAART
ncbi:helix-turn-helix domain-containing protein [Streptomyces sp. MK37H]|uniref:helix-turn-helix domain-containing protein n=1 Tax=Streptomyces sp. MK37H TaxID=2699117 RepID=UPI001B36B34F|nr:helix-turn-helix domain-containing protein [Streptomyces sp. MK37H]MBP8536126.1 DNA-binding protein [Streptomyces sp. MK37H]